MRQNYLTNFLSRIQLEYNKLETERAKLKCQLATVGELEHRLDCMLNDKFHELGVIAEVMPIEMYDDVILLQTQLCELMVRLGFQDPRVVSLETETNNPGDKRHD